MHLHDLERLLLEHATQSPNARLFLGVDHDLGALPDPSLEANQAAAEHALHLLALSEQIDPGDDFDANLDLQLARLFLKRDHLLRTLTFNGRLELAQKPTAGEDLGDGIFQLLITDHLSLPERFRLITDRVEAIPAYLQALLQRLDTPITRWVAIEQERIAGLPELLQSVLDTADRCVWSDTPRLERAHKDALAALKDYSDALALLPTQDNLHVGPDLTERIIQARGIDLSPDQLHAIATDFLATNAARIEALRATLVQRYDLPEDTDAPTLHHHLNQRFRVEIKDGKLESILDVYKQEHEKILEFISKNDLFDIPDGQDLLIIRTPTFLEAAVPAGAMCAPPPFREGVQTSLIYLTLRDDVLDEHTTIAIPSMMIHEGIPGHHLQFATAHRHPSTVRRLFDSVDLGEGWTTMLEDYMLDLGYMGDLTDEARFITQRELARLGARVGIDLFFMSGERRWLELGTGADITPEDAFIAAGNLLQHVTGFTAARVQAELNWYSQQRAYPLAYLTGNHLVWKLKRDVQRDQAPELQGLELDRRFHRTYLEASNMPMSFLPRVFEHVGLLRPEQTAG